MLKSCVTDIETRALPFLPLNNVFTRKLEKQNIFPEGYIYTNIRKCTQSKRQESCLVSMKLK